MGLEKWAPKNLPPVVVVKPKPVRKPRPAKDKE